jgi:hypothetical protein
MARALAAEAGCYEAWRAAALSGVPVSTVYYWARTELIVPSISPTKEMLWSYGDLMALRIVSWLRHTKRVENGLVYWDGQDWTGAHDDIVRRSPMREVRRALVWLDKLDLDIWRDGAEAESPSPLLVDRSGKVWIRTERGLTNTHGQWTVDLPAELFNLLAPFEPAGHRGPNLLKPRPSLRIVPLKVAGGTPCRWLANNITLSCSVAQERIRVGGHRRHVRYFSTKRGGCHRSREPALGLGPGRVSGECPGFVSHWIKTSHPSFLASRNCYLRSK